jgi:acetyl-CoA carboxylase biotin carboxyl carrier protein
MPDIDIQSPLPGTFYRRPSPDAPEYKQVGQAVAAGDVIGLVEVMKSFHEVYSQSAGKMLRFCIDNESSVEAGQTIAVIQA